MADFPATRHSVIARMNSRDEDVRRAAYGDLVEGYWKALHRYLRLQWRLSDDDAQELAQAFFSESFQKEWLDRYDPGKARFRTFVRVCADRFVMNTRQAAERLKRGGGAEMVPLDVPGAEEAIAALRLTTTPEAEECFHREFVRALFERSLDGVRKEYVAAGRHVHLALFERYDLDPAEGVSYAALAKEFGLTSAQVTNYLVQIRRSFRLRALETLRLLCGSDEEFRREGRELFGLEVE